jgi:HD-GYP domain-containing protein (c-di-GMP phosphodiesterase class II)
MGARAFLAKPFKREELVQALRGDCGIGASAVPSEQEADPSAAFCKIAIDQFVSGRIIKFEIFIRLADDKYTKIAHEGEDVALNRVLAFKGKGVDFLYVKKEDFAKYVGFNLTLSRAVKNSRTIPHEKKILLAQHASAVIMENLFVNGVDEEGFKQAKEITETTLRLLSESPQCFDLLEALSANGDPLYTHSLGVSLFAAMIAKQVGWSSPVTLFKISTAGLLHDIGLKEIDSAITGKQRSSLNREEVALLESHPSRSAKILGSIPSIPSDILQIVLHHHESCVGRGYPSNLSRSKINPMARLISVADEFCELAIAGPNSPGMPARDAIERLCMINADALDPEYMKALKAVVRK